MESLLKYLEQDLKRKIKSYEVTKTWVEDGFKKLTIGTSVNEYHSLQMKLSELSTLAAEINTIQEYIDTIKMEMK